ncbi:MAG: flavodoxin family protein [Bacteroidales bacterium]|nr:flavodoxin family protein [Bacteroidales bacterium]
MKTLVLNGSPKKNGTVAKLLKSIVTDLETKETLDWVNVYDLNLKPCIGCMKCRDTLVCCLPEDNAHKMATLINNVDNLIIGTPTYWGNMSAQLKMLLERVVPVFMGESAKGIPIPKQKGKKAIIVTACTTPYPFNFILAESRGAVNSVKEILKYGGYKIIGKLVKPGSKNNSKINSRLINKAHKLGSKI